MQVTRLHRIGPALALAVALAAPLGAAGQTFGKSQHFLGAHVGMSGVGSTAAYGVNGELAYNEHIGIGAWADTWSYGQSFGTALGGYDWNVRYIAVAGTGAYHFTVKKQPKVDPFLGAALGYYVVSTSVKGAGVGGTYGGSGSRMFLGGFGGARYFFKPTIAGVARVGFGADYLTLGVDWKM